MASPGSSGTTRSRRTNPFEGPDPVVIRDLNILARVPVVLDHLTSTYYAWKTYFSLVFREYNIRDHIDGSVDSRFMEDDEEWMSIDATLIRWFYTTISKDLFHTLDSSVDDYCMRLKKLVDELRDLGEKVSDELLLSTLIAGLSDDFGNTASNIPLITNPTFPKIVAYLKLEERRMRMSRTRVTRTALTAGTRGGVRPIAPPRPTPGPFQAPPPPGAHPAAHQALHAAPQAYQPVPLYGPSAVYGLPPAGGFVAPPPQPAPSAPALPPVPWDPVLLAALHTTPTPQQYTGGGDWYMDTGATAHMAANPGNLLAAHPVHTAARITVGDGSSMPITHVGHAAFPSNSMPLYLSNVLVSPDIIKNLVSVRSLTRQNPVTVEFDMFGFSVKDARTRMVLHRCDSPDELYPVHSSTSSVAAPMALFAGVPSDVAALPAPGDGRSRASLRPPPGFEGAPRATGRVSPRLAALGAAPPSAPATPLASPASTTPAASPAASPAAVSPAASPAAMPVASSTAASPAAVSEEAGSSSSSPVSTPDPLPRPMTRSRAGTLRPSTRYPSDEYLLAASVSEPSPLPLSARAALRDPHWLAAMQEEFEHSSGTVPGSSSLGRPVPTSSRGHLAEQVFCEQPTGFVDATHPDHVCLLSRSLYGLKQAPRAWYQRIAAFLQTLRFTSTRSDASLFVYHHGVDTAYLLLYVDDIILTASTVALLQRLTARLRDEFALKDLGPLHYFLGIEMVRRPDGFFLHQQRYAHELLDRAGMLNCKPAPTPVDTKAKVSALEGSPASDAAFYRSIVGALQYLTLTRPDLQYAF
ncbi:uncharacterized protein [Aegilops tauschii subsp. strangulata]|uniref:uncharacterized protein n=1 Tax=Aegilops tauschii subsp. strangulata TaxID=200361 RepID=UPI00098B0645|nr:proline-rich protein 36-like [Aegilops tauschii subsp. strangulata]